MTATPFEDGLPVCVLKSRRFPLHLDEVSDGGSLNALLMVEGLLAKGIAIHVYTRREGGESEIYTAGRLTVCRVDYAPSPATDLFMRDLAEGMSFVGSVAQHGLFRSSVYQCIHSHHWTSAVGLSELLHATVRWVHTPHFLAHHKAHYLGLPCPRAVLAAETAILRRADQVIALSRHEKDAISVIVPDSAKRVVVIPNGVGDDFYATPARPTMAVGRPLSLLSIGRICRQKGFDVLLDTMTLLLAKNCFAELRIAGGFYAEPEYEEQFRARLMSTSLSKHVVLLGPVRHEDVPALHAGADIYLQPSRYESQGIALLEAMASARPVIASRLPAVEAFLVDRVSGLLVDHSEREAEELTTHVLALQRDPSFSLSLAKEARAVARRFSWARAIQDTSDLVLGVS